MINATDSYEFNRQEPLTVSSHIYHPDIAHEPSQIVNVVELCTILIVHKDNPVHASHHYNLIVSSDIHGQDAILGLGEDLHCIGREYRVEANE